MSYKMTCDINMTPHKIIGCCKNNFGSIKYKIVIIWRLEMVSYTTSCNDSMTTSTFTQCLVILMTLCMLRFLF